MTAAMSSSLGSAPAALRPPAGAPQAGPHVNRGGGGSTRAERGTTFASEAVGATARQIDCWARTGLLGPDQQEPGTGRRRKFDDDDLEVIAALRSLAALGATEHWLQAGADIVRTGRVAAGEWLLVTIAGHALRCSAADLPRVIHRDGAAHAAWLIPLQAFDQGQPQ